MLKKKEYNQIYFVYVSHSSIHLVRFYFITSTRPREKEKEKGIEEDEKVENLFPCLLLLLPPPTIRLIGGATGRINYQLLVLLLLMMEKKGK